jgi:NAD(P)H-hydrate epimerase
MEHMFPEIEEASVPFLTTAQMVEVDRAMVEDYGIRLIQMMENAGRNLAHLARVRFFWGEPKGQSVAVLAGVGGNGGGALVCARRLRGWGANVEVFVTKPRAELTEVPRHQLGIIEAMNIPVRVGAPSTGTAFDLVVDGVIGYSLDGAPRGTSASMIRWTVAQSGPVLSLDVPSGVDSTSGSAFDPATSATATMTLALPKEGLRASSVRAHVGELYLADIGVPPELYGRPPLRVQVSALFAESDIVRLV